MKPHDAASVRVTTATLDEAFKQAKAMFDSYFGTVDYNIYETLAIAITTNTGNVIAWEVDVRAEAK